MKFKAFSLVEIVFALGIVSFALVAILGLLSVSLSASKASKEDTVLVSMLDKVSGNLRRQDFDTLATEITSDKSEYFFDAKGRQIDNQSKALYACTIEGKAVSNPANLLLATIKFQWPAGAANGNTRTFQIGLARYD